MVNSIDTYFLEGCRGRGGGREGEAKFRPGIERGGQGFVC